MKSELPPAPYGLLDRWISHLDNGRALDLGAGQGEVAIWLADAGFAVDAVEGDPISFDHLREAVSETNVHCIEADITEIQMDPESYSLITCFGVLHFLRPTELWILADRLIASMTAGALLICEVFTTDDPEFGDLMKGDVTMIEPNTYRLPHSQDVIHYFEMGELTRVFSELEVREYEEYRRIDPGSKEGYRAGAGFVGRKRK